MNSLKKFLVVLIVIATGLGAAMLFRKQDAELEASNASGAKAASAEAASSDGESPESKSRQAVPLPADGQKTASGLRIANGADDARPIPVPSRNSVAPSETSRDSLVPSVRPTIRTPPVVPPAFPPFQPREIAADTAESVETSDEDIASANDPIGAPSRYALPIESEANVEPIAPPSVPNRVAPSTPPPLDVATEPRPVEASKPVASQPPTLRSHKIVNGDTLARIARRYLGSEGRSAEIFELNRDVLTDPLMLPLGHVIKIPPRESTADASTVKPGGTVLPLPPLVPLPSGAFARP